MFCPRWLAHDRIPLPLIGVPMGKIIPAAMPSRPKQEPMHHHVRCTMVRGTRLGDAREQPWCGGDLWVGLLRMYHDVCTLSRTWRLANDILAWSMEYGIHIWVDPETGGWESVPLNEVFCFHATPLLWELGREGSPPGQNGGTNASVLPDPRRAKTV